MLCVAAVDQQCSGQGSSTHLPAPLLAISKQQISVALRQGASGVTPLDIFKHTCTRNFVIALPPGLNARNTQFPTSPYASGETMHGSYDISPPPQCDVENAHRAL